MPNEVKVHKIIRKFTVTVTQEYETADYSSVASFIADFSPLRPWGFKTISIQPATKAINVTVMTLSDSNDRVEMDIDLSGKSSTVTDTYKAWLRE